MFCLGLYSLLKNTPLLSFQDFPERSLQRKSLNHVEKNDWDTARNLAHPEKGKDVYNMICFMRYNKCII